MLKKSIFVLGLALAAVSARGDEGYLTLGKQNAALLPSNASKALVWISYVGKLSNVCGFQILATSPYHVEGEDLQRALVVSNRDTNLPIALNQEQVAEVVVAKLSDPQLYGAFISVRTKSGESFEEVVTKIITEKTTAPENIPTDLVLTAKLCQ
jgi:hypothetical protein